MSDTAEEVIAEAMRRHTNVIDGHSVVEALCVCRTCVVVQVEAVFAALKSHGWSLVRFGDEDVRERAVEAGARALYEKCVPPDPWWEGEDDYIKNIWRERAAHALDAAVAVYENGEAK